MQKVVSSSTCNVTRLPHFELDIIALTTIVRGSFIILTVVVDALLRIALVFVIIIVVVRTMGKADL